MHACVKDIAILVKNMSLGSSGEEKVSRSLSSCSSCFSICLRLFSRFSADTETQPHISRHTPTFVKAQVPKKCEGRSRERTTQLQVQSNALLFWGSERIREKQNTKKKKITGKIREKPVQLQSMLITGSRFARNTMGINNDWGKNKHQVKVSSIHSFVLFCMPIICSCECQTLNN